MNRMKQSENCRDVTMTIRITSKERGRIRKQAEEEGKTVSTYVAETALAGLERNNSRIKKSLIQMVKNQETFNRFFEKMSEMGISDSNEVYLELVELAEGENRLWECLCR